MRSSWRSVTTGKPCAISLGSMPLSWRKERTRARFASMSFLSAANSTVATLSFRDMRAADSKVVSGPMSEGLAAKPAGCWGQIIGLVEAFLDAVREPLLEEGTAFEPELVPYAEYGVSVHGKHLRPALVA